MATSDPYDIYDIYGRVGMDRPKPKTSAPKTTPSTKSSGFNDIYNFWDIYGRAGVPKPSGSSAPKPQVNNTSAGGGGIDPLKFIKTLGASVAAVAPWPFKDLIGGMVGQPNNTPVNGGGAGAGGQDFSDLIMDADRLGNAAKTTPNLYNGTNAGNITDDAGLDNGWDEMSYEDAIAQAQAILSGMGYGSAISYDPLRDTARSQWSDADAKTKAMYDQLQASIRGEAAPLAKVFDTAVADTRTGTQEHIGDLNAAAQSSADIKTQQAKALGIEEAVANSIARGSDPSQDVTRDIADASARGQITEGGLTENKTSALTRNNDWVASAGLQGAQTRDLRLAELSKVLAQLDVGEQEANAKQQNDFRGEALSLAGDMIGTNRDDLSEMNTTQWRAQMGADDAWYDLQRILQGGQSSSASNKPAILSHDAAVSRALSDFGYADLEEVAGRDEQIKDKFRKYVLTLEGR